jgi:hypothetical protein
VVVGTISDVHFPEGSPTCVPCVSGMCGYRNRRKADALWVHVFVPRGGGDDRASLWGFHALGTEVFRGLCVPGVVGYTLTHSENVVVGTHIYVAWGSCSLRANGICCSGVPIELSHVCVDGILLIPMERKADALECMWSFQLSERLAFPVQVQRCWLG